jgi:hypothetical protein
VIAALTSGEAGRTSRAVGAGEQGRQRKLEEFGLRSRKQAETRQASGDRGQHAPHQGEYVLERGAERGNE